MRPLNNLGDGEGLARTGHPQQHLVALARLDPGGQFRDCLWLITGRLVFRNQFKGAPALALWRPRYRRRDPGCAFGLGQGLFETAADLLHGCMWHGASITDFTVVSEIGISR